MKKIFIICLSFLFLISCQEFYSYEYVVVDSEYNNIENNEFSKYLLKFIDREGSNPYYIKINAYKNSYNVGDTLFSIDRGVVCESKN